MSTFARASRPGLESAATGDDIFATADSMAKLRTRGGPFGKALEETPAAARDHTRVAGQGRAARPAAG